jgi:hypothetical protein
VASRGRSKEKVMPCGGPVKKQVLRYAQGDKRESCGGAREMPFNKLREGFRTLNASQRDAGLLRESALEHPGELRSPTQARAPVPTR